MNIRNILPEPLAVLLRVKEAKRGIETYIHPNIGELEEAYKRQLIAFIDEVRLQLGKHNRDTTVRRGRRT